MFEWLNSSLRRRIKRHCRNNSLLNQLLPLEESSISTTVELIPDELLLEILLLLRNVRSIFQCSLVCKRWSSLIHRHRQDLLSSTTTVFFGFSRSHHHRPLHELFPERSSVETGGLSFLPGAGAVIRASSEDLLLVSQGRPESYLVCNPLTREWTALPWDHTSNGSLLNRVSGYGLVLGKKRDSFTVAIFRSSWLSMFSSETGQWITKHLPKVSMFYSLSNKPRFDAVSTSSGAMHWLDGTREKFRGIVAINPVSMNYKFFNFPSGKRSIARLPRPSKDKICIGVVRGRLRLSRLDKVNKMSTGLRIWELEEDWVSQNSSWTLVHKATLKRASDMSFVLSMHPSNGDVVFVVCDREIFSLSIGQNKYTKVGDFPCQDEALSGIQEKVGLHMKVFPLMHSLFPTPLPHLPCVLSQDS